MDAIVHFEDYILEVCLFVLVVLHDILTVISYWQYESSVKVTKKAGGIKVKEIGMRRV